MSDIILHSLKTLYLLCNSIYNYTYVVSMYNTSIFYQLSRSVAHYHKENCMQQAKTEKEEHLKLRKIASAIAKEVKFFWDSMRKVINVLRLILEDLLYGY